MEWKEPTNDDLAKFIREHLLPRITQLEQEVYHLRRVTWPVCQALREKWATDDIPEKWKVLGLLHCEDARQLINTKQRIKPDMARNGIKFPCGGWSGMREEWDALVEFGNRSRSVPTHVFDEFLKGEAGTPTNATDLRRVSQEGIHLARSIELGIDPDHLAPVDDADL
jgi:hypothetical protein